jgi:hypothetical protein
VIPQSHRPQLLITVHGIRTDAGWQKAIAPVFGPHCELIESYDYGRYSALRFIQPWKNRQMVDRFYQWYGQTLASSPNVDSSAYDKRPSCIAHSFGSWIVGQAMLKHADIKFDKILFCGSVLPAEFDWDRLIARGQVGNVANECGSRDFWPYLAAKFVAGAGAAGSRGFTFCSSVVVNEKRDDFRHSDTLLRAHMTNVWRPFLLGRPSPLFVVHGRSIETREEFIRILHQTRGRIDQIVYGHEPNYRELRIAEGRSLDWTSVNPDIYTFLIDHDTKNVAGYINAMPVTDGVYNDIKGGKKLDKDITASDIVTFDTRVNVKLYLMSIAIHPDSRVYGEGILDQAFVRLATALVEKLIFYAEEREVFVTSLLAVTWTPAGEKICQYLGMKRIGTDAFHHPVYEVDIESLLAGKEKIYRPLAKLLRVYRNLGR